MFLLPHWIIFLGVVAKRGIWRWVSEYQVWLRVSFCCYFGFTDPIFAQLVLLWALWVQVRRVLSLDPAFFFSQLGIYVRCKPIFKKKPGAHSLSSSPQLASCSRLYQREVHNAIWMIEHVNNVTRFQIHDFTNQPNLPLFQCKGNRQLYCPWWGVR